jgi:hypothetical protein
MGTFEIICDEEKGERCFPISETGLLWCLITGQATDNDVNSSARTLPFENNAMHGVQSMNP